MAPLYNTRETFSNIALYTTTPPTSSSKQIPLPFCLICTEPCTRSFVGSTHHALKMPSCSHIFGACCIETWFDTASTCPLCRKDFFRMKPEEVSPELQELPGLFLQMFTLLSEVKKRYPQGRMIVTGMENMIADLGEKAVKDTEERKERTRMREEAERARIQRMQEIDNRLGIEEASPSYQPLTFSSTEITTSGSVILGHNTVVFLPPTLSSTRREIDAFLAHDFGPDLAALESSERAPNPESLIALQLAQGLARRAENLGLVEAAEDVRRRGATVENVIRLLRERDAGRLDQERRRIEHLQGVRWRAEIERRRTNEGRQRAQMFAGFEEEMGQRRWGWSWSWWGRN